MHLSNQKASRGFLASVDRNLATSAAVIAAGVAGVASFATPQSAQAVIVYSGPVNINIPSTTAGIYLNLATGVFATTPGGAPGWDINPWGSTSWNVWANNAAGPTDGVIMNYTTGSSATLVDNVPTGTIVDNSWSYSRTNSVETTGATAFAPGNNNYVGIRFLNEGTGVVDFGWVHFSLTNLTAGQPQSVIDYAYENTGAPIAVGNTGGTTPEPASLGLLAVGALGLLKRRGR